MRIISNGKYTSNDSKRPEHKKDGTDMALKVMSVFGTRPEAIKMCPLIKELEHHKEIESIVCLTGQHREMLQQVIDIFGTKVQYNLDIMQPRQTLTTITTSILEKLEPVLQEERPDIVLVHGDTSTSFAAALASFYQQIPVGHVEAGLRSYNRAMPEEQNRVLTDHISEILFCPTDTAVAHLKEEGIIRNVYQVGDVMCDAVMYYSKEMEKLDRKYFFSRLNGLYSAIEPLERWYLATVHRAENTDTTQKVNEILAAFEEFSSPVIFPVHPRTKPIVNALVEEHKYRNIIFVEPIGYLDMLYFTKNAVKVVTDSGGLQKEAYILETDSVTVREQTEWVETLEGNYNILCKPLKEDILEKVYHTEVSKDKRRALYGQGNAAEKISNVLKSGKM